MTAPTRDPSEIAEIVALVGQAGGTLPFDELVVQARRLFDNPTLPDQVVAQLIEQADTLSLDGTTVVATTSTDVRPDTGETPPGGSRPLRAVAIDFETIPLQIAEPPYVDPVPYQVAAIRFGADHAWVGVVDDLDCHIAVPERAIDLLTSGAARAAVATAPSPDAVSGLLRRMLDGADVVVAYNGTMLDFPVLAGLLGQLPDRVAPVDALYVAHALWPRRQTTAGHRLFPLAEYLGVDMTGPGGVPLLAHDAHADTQVMIRLLRHAADVLASWPADHRTLIGAATAGSHAWQLLFDLAGLARPVAPPTSAAARDAITELLDDLPQVRRHTEDEPASVTVPAQLQQGGITDPGRLVSVLRQVKATTRPAQEQMRQLLDQMRHGGQVLVEAPTGTGKTAAMLAAALDHLAADPANRVVISTFTKQLQLQLAEDLQSLHESGVVPGLGPTLDLVKGARNRLSLRSLVATVTGLASDTRTVPARLADQARFRELVVYLLLRLADATPDARLIDTWDARSVDIADVPGFFTDYTSWQLPGWLAELSQGRAGDLPDRGDDPLAGRTRDVREAVQASRLVIANHALLLANVTAFTGQSGRTLLMVDEAHSLESAATSTIEVSFEYGQVEAITAELARIATLVDGTPEQRALLAATVARLQEVLEFEQLPRAAGNVLDISRTQATLPGRHMVRAAAAAADVDAVTARRGVGLLLPLSALRARLSDCFEALEALPDPSDGALRDTYHTLRQRLLDTVLAVAVVRRDVHDLVAGDEDDAEEGGGRSADRHDPSNRVVWLEELPSDTFANRGWRWFAFRITSSPIVVPDEPAWHEFQSTFPAVAYVSATLRLPGADDPWAFIRSRLGLDAAVTAKDLPSPFDPATQAELVCFEDFPSWAEQPEGALRTVAHQLGGFIREVTSRSDDGTWQDGAMLLSTSRAAAAGIADLLLRATAGHSDRPPVHSAILHGNGPAVERFRADGGLLAGTKGLWQGVDIADPGRLRLVWINKLPFGAVGDPVLDQRMARVRAAAEAAGAADPDLAAMEQLYLPLAAIDLRQAVGRLIRSREHRGVVVISDSKLGGSPVLRRTYRRLFLASLDPGYLKADPDDPDDVGAGNVVPMEEGWRRIFTFLGNHGVLPASRVRELTDPERLPDFVWLPHTRTVRDQALSFDEQDELTAEGHLADVLLERAAVVGGALKLQDTPVQLRDRQVDALRAVAAGDDLLAVLPTGYGKSFTFQLPALVLPGVTLVISPLVSLMTDQALHLNRTIGGAVRALTGPMRESNSRLGKAEVAEQLTNPDARHGIRIVYLSPERLAQRQFQEQIRAGVAAGIVRRIAFDEAHTLAQWGDDFRPQFRRAEAFVRELRRDHPALRLIAVTATATETVRTHLRQHLFGHADPSADAADVDGFTFVTANPVRRDLAVYRRRLPVHDWTQAHYQSAGLVEQVLEVLDGHAIVYAMTVREVEALHGYLQEQVGTTRTVLRYHGRMSPTEKAATTDAFMSAPSAGEDTFKPMVVVATAAFGLGIDRPDIRTVLLASPPMDLAALYQQLGRAGRDQVATNPDDLTLTVGMALLTGRGWSTLRFFLQQRPEREDTLDRIAARILSSTDPYLDASDLGSDLLAEDVAAGRLREDDGDNPHVLSAYRTMVLRVFAALAATGHIDDHGDFPKKARIRPGQAALSEGTYAQAILDAAGTTSDVELLAVWAQLPEHVRLDLGDPGMLWSEMMLLHASGHLDVTQRTSDAVYRTTTGYRRLRSAAQPGFSAALMQHLRTAERELERLRAWFEPHGETCANETLREYFNAPDLPEDTCAADANRCSSCWDMPDQAVRARPALHTAFFTPDPAPRSKVAAAQRTQRRRLDRTVVRLLKMQRKGTTATLLLATLRGEPKFRTRNGTMPVFDNLRQSAYFGAHPGTTDKVLKASLSRLVESGDVGQDPSSRFWRHRDHLVADQRAEEPADV